MDTAKFLFHSRGKCCWRDVVEDNMGPQEVFSLPVYFLLYVCNNDRKFSVLCFSCRVAGIYII